MVTHVLLPVTVLLRRADAAGVIWAGLLARAAGEGHRPIGLLLGVPESTVRGWLRRLASRLESVRVHFVLVARRAGVDKVVPKALGSSWQDVVAAVGAATSAVTGRFGTAGVIGPVTACRWCRPPVVVGFFHLVGRPVCRVPVPTRVAPDGPPVGPGSSRGALPGNTCRAGPTDKESGHVVNGFDQDAVKRRQRAQQVALFRYQLICPALEPGLSTKQRGKLVRGIAGRSHDGPFGGRVQATATISTNRK